ncbi:mechanosensitive ion channel domain-containing protein [Phormidium sp. FACHB-1136]|uniref:mechanosensitive ion channel family protein n=1 Tax=Phormidium sp. FACHB-1136 TaxID=2692848 RepID=UPI0018EF9014|nr:mechanosensitive ion channel domain-containing protein [Phormidium sp. FACHB-1136]
MGISLCRCQRWLQYLGLGLALSLWSVGLGWAGFALAQEAPPETASVFLDSIFLFEVPGSAELTASERAAAIGTNLAPLLELDTQPNVRIQSRTGDKAGNPVIFVDDRYIMTVTQADADLNPAKTPVEQAQIWVEILNQGLAQAQAERRGDFWITALARSAVAVAVALAIQAGLGWLGRRWLLPLVARWGGRTEEDGRRTGLGLLLRLMFLVVQGAVWFSALTYIANLFPLTRRFSYVVGRSLTEGLLARSLVLGSRAYSLLDLLLLLAVLMALVIAANTVTNLLRSRILNVAGISLSAQEAIAVLSKYTLMLLGAVVVLQIWGIDLSSLALIASGLGIGIGFGLQGLVRDFVSGLVLVFERPVQVGDFVDFGAVKGTVNRIGSRSTEIRTLDHVAIIVPNSRLLDQEIINWSHGNPVSRIRLPVGVAYASDPTQVKQVLLEACRQSDEILITPLPQVFFLGFGDNALRFELLVWIAQPHRQLVIKSDLYFAIEALLRQHHIEVPFPQRDLHLRTGSLPLEFGPDAQQWLQRMAPDSEDGRQVGR